MAAIDGNGPGDDERWLYGDEPEEERMPTPETVSQEAEIPASIVEALRVSEERELKTSNVESGASVSELSKSDGILDRPPGVDDEDKPLPGDDEYEGEANENLDADDKEGDEPFDDGDKEPFDEPLDDDTKKDAGKNEDGDSDSSDDNVNITIGEASKVAAAAPAYGGYGFGKRVGFGAHLAIGKAANAIPLGEIEGSGTISGKPAHEFSLDSVEDYPWRKPGADITDYFNYGFNEETWRAYCDRQRRMRLESGVITYKQGQSMHANVLQPNLNPQPRYREFYRDRDAAAPSTNGMPPIPMPPRPIPAMSPMTFSMSAAMPGPLPKKTIDVIGGSSGTSRRSLEIDETKAIQVMSGSVLKVAHYPKEEGKFETDDFNTVDLSMPPPDMSRPPPVFPSGQPHVTVLPPRMDPYGDMYALENDPYYRSYEPPGLPPPLSEMKSLPDWMPPPAGLPPPMGVPPPLPPGMMQPPAPRAPVAGLGLPPPPPSSLSSRFSSGNDGGPPPCPPGEDSLPAPPAVSVKREPRPNNGDDGGRSSSGSDSDDVEAGAGGVRPAVDRDVPAVTVIPQSSSSHSARRRSASRREDKDRRHSSRRRSRSRSPSASSAGEESLSHRRDRERDRDRDRDRDQDRDKEREGDRDRDRHRDRERERDRDRRDRDKDKDKERDRDRERERERDRDSRHRSSRKRARHHSSSPTSD